MHSFFLAIETSVFKIYVNHVTLHFACVVASDTVKDCWCVNSVHSQHGD